jgi:hypothetical protein
MTRHVTRDGWLHISELQTARAVLYAQTATWLIVMDVLSSLWPGSEDDTARTWEYPRDWQVISCGKIHENDCVQPPRITTARKGVACSRRAYGADLHLRLLQTIRWGKIRAREAVRLAVTAREETRWFQT